MELSWLNTFIVAAQHENFRKTAEVLYISQPSVTVHIKLLEKEIGSPLFERKGRKIKLTEEGRHFQKFAKSLLAHYEKGLTDLHSFNQGFSRKLTIAISPLIADTILPYVLKSFLNKYPEVEIAVKILESIDIEKAVLKEEVDIGLSCLGNLNNDLQCELLYEDPVVLVASHDGKDSETAPPLDDEELLMTNYLLTHNHPDYWENLLKALKYQHPGIKTMKVSQVHITKRFIAEGLGVSFLPTSTVRRELMEGRLLEVDCQIVKLPIAKTYAITKYEHTLEQTFLNHLSQFRI